MNAATHVLNIIKSCGQKNKTKLIAIDGLGGSGKTTFVKQLVELDSSLKVLELDHFPCLPEEHPYHPVGAQTRVNLARFQAQALIPLTLGQPAIYQNTFWWPTDAKPQRHVVQPGGVVLVEGCYSTHSELRRFYDFSIWIACPEEEAIKRAIARDGKQGVDIWEQVHAPNERRYARLQRPMDHVNLLIRNKGNGGKKWNQIKRPQELWEYYLIGEGLSMTYLK